MKRSTSLRTQMILLMTVLVVLQSISLVMALSFSKAFVLLDAESFRLFNNTTIARKQALDNELGQLIRLVTDDTRIFNQDLQKITDEASRKRLADADIYNEIATSGAEYLIHLLQSCNINGAFFMLASDDNQPMPSVYIRSAAPKDSYALPENFLLEVGPLSVSQRYVIPNSSHHSLFAPFDFNGPDAKKWDFYYQPTQAALDFPRSELERYGYWSAPTSLLSHLPTGIFYTLPLLNSGGYPIGVFGIEITQNYFSQHYLPLIDLPYQDSFYAITPIDDQLLTLDWFISSSPLAHNVLKQQKNLRLTHAGPADNIYSSYLEDFGDMYCFVQPLMLYSRNSPFPQNSWNLVSFVPQETLHATSTQVRDIVSITIIATALAAFAAIFLLSHISTRKIFAMSKYLTGLDPYQPIKFKRTGMIEFDELADAVEKLNKSVIHASETTSRILKLSLLPIGGFELTAESDQVIVTDYIYSLLQLEPHEKISLKEWRAHYAILTASPAPEYDNIYYFSSSSHPDGIWLRILESRTATGSVGVVLDVTRDIEEHRRLLHELDFDAMTNLYNRQAFKREANAKITYEPSKIGVMIFSDLDNLKYINDNFGHEIGDRLILRASEMFQEFSAYGGIVARISGDEFAIYLHGFSSRAEARKLINRQFKLCERYELTTPDGSSHRIRFSSGIAWYPDDSNEVTDLLKLADFAMYEAKRKEKGVVYEFNKQSYDSKFYLLENREAIHHLIDERLIHFNFQPIVDLRTGSIYAYEALMRSSSDAFKGPLEILAVATAQSQLAQLERLVYSVVLETLDRHIDELTGLHIFINSIPSHLISQEELMALGEYYGYLFPQLVVEVTERESGSLEEKFSDPLSFLRTYGMKLALDDFGSGYSSESRILTIQPNIVKIDMVLIQGIHSNLDKQQLITNLVYFCHSRNILLVGEGVEDEADLEKLIELNVDLVQGFYVAKPTPGFDKIPTSIRNQIRRLHAQYHPQKDS